MVLAGGCHYSQAEAKAIVEAALEHLGSSPAPGAPFVTGGLAPLRLGLVHPTWRDRLLLAARNYLGDAFQRAFQVLPDPAELTLDVPDMSESYDTAREAVWRWLDETPDVESSWTAVTDLDALRGAPVTEIARWEDADWELFSGPGPEVRDEDTRVVPLATMLALDPSLTPVLDLEVGEALWRTDGDSGWTPWRKGGS